MIRTLLPFTVRDQSEFSEPSDQIEDVVLFDRPDIDWRPHPMKLAVTVAVICLKGTMTGRTNMHSFHTHAPCLVVLMMDQTVAMEDISKDFSGLFIVMSRKFTDRLDIGEKLPVFLSLHNRPFIPLLNKDLLDIQHYFRVMKHVLDYKNNTRTSKILQYITMACFYWLDFNVIHIEEHGRIENKPRQEQLLENFLAAVRDNFRTERGTAFYANKLCVTPRHMSKVIKTVSGLSAKEWIDDYVIWECKALLKSTEMTIQQISYELNFPSQSFFGKFFRRTVGLSPFEYRKS